MSLDLDKSQVPDFVLKALEKACENTLITLYTESKALIDNQEAEVWLTSNLSLYTDYNKHTVAGHDVDFCWKTEKWFVTSLSKQGA